MLLMFFEFVCVCEHCNTQRVEFTPHKRSTLRTRTCIKLRIDVAHSRAARVSVLLSRPSNQTSSHPFGVDVQQCRDTSMCSGSSGSRSGAVVRRVATQVLLLMLLYVLWCGGACPAVRMKHTLRRMYPPPYSQHCRVYSRVRRICRLISVRQSTITIAT